MVKVQKIRFLLNAIKNEENKLNNAMFLMFLENAMKNEENKGNNDAMRLC